MASKNKGDFDNVDDTELNDDDHRADVLDELKPLASQYPTFGAALGIKPSDIDTIGTDHATYPGSVAKLNRVIALCLQKQYNFKKHGPPTWKKFVTTAAKFNYALAEKIAEGHLAAPPEVKAPPPAPTPTSAPILTTPTVAPNLLEIITHANTTVESLNRECTKDAIVLGQLANCCHPVSIVGPHLNLEDHEMEAIEDDNRGRSEQKRVAMLKKWHKKFTHKATYLALVQALANSGRNSQAADICKIVAAQEVPTQPPATGPGRESQQYNQPPTETTRAVPEVHTTPVPKPPTGHLPDHGYGQYLAASKKNIQTVHEHWELAKIHKRGITGKGITIAIIDDGLNRSHVSISKKCGGDNPQISGYAQWHHDQAEHGTAITAIAVGEEYTTDTGVYVPPGIAPGAKLYIYRLGEKFGAEELSDALEHILTLTNTQRIDVVAMSLCLPGLYKDIQNQLKKLAEKKVVCVAAAGNSGIRKRGAQFPANDSNVLSVGALKESGQVADITPDSGIDVYAFGENVVAPSLTAIDATSNLDGTSYAVPMVAGFLALLFQCTNSEDFPGCKGLYDAYHDVSFLRQHFIKCHKLCENRSLQHVGSYFTDLWKCRKLKPSPLVEFYREVFPQ